MIASIDIENIYGLEKLEFKPGMVTVINGDNGTGKSSLVSAIAACFEGGIRPERLRIGAEKGHVRMVLEDGSKVEFRAWLRKKRGTDEKEAAQESAYITKDGVTLPAAATLIKELGDALAVDPAKLLACDVTTAAGRKALQQAILDVIPFTVTADDLPAAVIHNTEHEYEVDAREKAASVLRSPVDLGGLRKARMALEETRRQVGVAAKQAASAVQGLRGGIASEASPGDTQARLEQAEEALGAHRQVIRDEQAKGKQEANAARVEAEKAYHARLREIDATEREVMTWIESEYSAHETELATQVVALKTEVAAIQRAEGARQQIAILERQAADKDYEYAVFSKSIEMLDTVRSAKLANSPIPELTVEGDDICVDGKPWQIVNTARRVQVVVQLCALRAGRLKFLLLDNAEHLGEDTWTALKAALVDAGFQVVAAFVRSGSPLTVSTEAA